MSNRRRLPQATIVVDHWQLVRLANPILTEVRQRASSCTGAAARPTRRWGTAGCCCAPATASGSRSLRRLQHVLAHDDSTDEIGAVWGVNELLRRFVVEFVSLFFARALFVWFYNRTGSSVLLVAIFHASFDAAYNELSYDVVPGSNAARFLIFSAVIVLFATAVIIAKGQLGRRAATRTVEGDIADEHTPDETVGREDPRPSAPPDACDRVPWHVLYRRPASVLIKPMFAFSSQ